MRAFIPLITCAFFASCAAPGSQVAEAPAPVGALDLGNFSVSLSVKDLAVSRAFYESLGFRVPSGAPMEGQGYVILQNGHATIGLFQGMFEGNILTFNPGWDRSAQNVDPFTDVREIQRQLEGQGIQLIERADPSTDGPAFVTLTDPDGNTIFIDQHR